MASVEMGSSSFADSLSLQVTESRESYQRISDVVEEPLTKAAERRENCRKKFERNPYINLLTLAYIATEIATLSLVYQLPNEPSSTGSGADNDGSIEYYKNYKIVNLAADFILFCKANQRVCSLSFIPKLLSAGSFVTFLACCSRLRHNASNLTFAMSAVDTVSSVGMFLFTNFVRDKYSR